MKSSVFMHVVAALLFSLLLLLVYITVEQTCRMAAGYPQTARTRSIAQDVRYMRIYHYLSAGKTNPQCGAGTFVQLYNQKGQLLYSGGRLKGTAPQLPEGGLHSTMQKMEHAATGQPVFQVRLAAVTACATSPDAAVVVVARSLPEAENREADLIKIMLMAWATGLFIIGMHWLMHFKTND